MTPDELEHIGQHLYGKHWRAKLARQLSRDPGAVTHWMSGKNGIPKTAERRIRALAEKSIPRNT